MEKRSDFEWCREIPRNRSEHLGLTSFVEIALREHCPWTFGCIMIKDSIIAVMEAAGGCEGKGYGDGLVIRLVLDVFGEPVDLVVNVKEEGARLADIVPLARAVSAKITDKVGEIARLNGATIPCGKGCSACCNYLVPLALPEVFRLREEVLDMPLVRQLLIERPGGYWRRSLRLRLPKWQQPELRTVPPSC